MDSLPDEVISNILLLTINIEDISNFLKVNRRISRLSTVDFWKEKYIRDFGPCIENEHVGYRILYIRRKKEIRTTNKKDKNLVLNSAIEGNTRVFNPNNVKYSNSFGKKLILAAAMGKNLKIFEISVEYVNSKGHNTGYNLIEEYILDYLLPASNSSDVIIDYLIKIIINLIDAYQVDYPHKHKNYCKDLLNDSQWKFRGDLVYQFMTKYYLANPWKMAMNTLKNDNVKGLRFLYTKYSYDVTENNALLFSASSNDCRQCVNFLLSINGVDKSKLLHGAVHGSHFNLVRHILDNCTLTLDELTEGISYVDVNYSDCSYYTLQMLIEKGGDPKQFISRDRVDKRYKNEIFPTMDIYDQVTLFVSDIYFKYNLDIASAKSLTKEQLNAILETFMYNFPVDDYRWRMDNIRLNEIFSDLLSLQPNLNEWLIVIVTHGHKYLFDRISTNGDHDVNINILLEEILISPGWCDINVDENKYRIALTLLREGGDIEFLFNLILDLSHNIDLDDPIWMMMFSLSLEVGRRDLIQKVGQNPDNVTILY